MKGKNWHFLNISMLLLFSIVRYIPQINGDSIFKLKGFRYLSRYLFTQFSNIAAKTQIKTIGLKYIYWNNNHFSLKPNQNKIFNSSSPKVLF
jgi:hypothetical protein